MPRAVLAALAGDAPACHRHGKRPVGAVECGPALVSALASLRVYRFEPGAVFEGGLVGAVERMQFSGDAKLLDALFVTHDAASGALAAVEHTASAPTALDDAVARCHGRLIADHSVNARALAQVGSQLHAAAVSATPL
jgi:hypothetical protein